MLYLQQHTIWDNGESNNLVLISLISLAMIINFCQTLGLDSPFLYDNARKLGTEILQIKYVMSRQIIKHKDHLNAFFSFLK